MKTSIQEWWTIHFGSTDAKASLWVARSERGLSVEEQACLDKWLSEDARHEEAYFETQVIWQGMDVLGDQVPEKSSKRMNSNSGVGRWVY